MTSYYSGDAITSVVGDATLTADFADDGTLSGNAGCNNYNGPYEIDGDSISIGPLAGTKMACTSEELTTQETDYLAALELATSFSVTGDRLDLSATAAPSPRRSRGRRCRDRSVVVPGGHRRGRLPPPPPRRRVGVRLGTSARQPDGTIAGATVAPTGRSASTSASRPGPCSTPSSPCSTWPVPR